MNEWDLQKILTEEWIDRKFNFNSSFYELICWELMFPSWEINNAKSKWNEPSIDFILYSKEKSEFLCVELKNKIEYRLDLLLGFCQVTHRTIQFKKQYNVNKIKNAQFICYNQLGVERGSKKNVNINFDTTPNIKRILMAKEFPSNVKGDEYFDFFNSLNLNDLHIEISKYAKYKEFERIKVITNDDFQLLNEVECKKIKI